YGTAQMAANWTPWWIEDPAHDPIWAQPEYKPAERRHFSNRVFEGEHAQQWFTFYKSHYGGIYQQVTGVTPGQRYRFSLVAQVWSSSQDDANTSVDAGDPRFEIGIDPTGAARPGWVSSAPSSVEWSGVASMTSIIDKWGVVTVEATAQSSTITVYVKTNPQYAVKHNDIYIDAAQLVAVGAVPTPEPEPEQISEPAPAPAEPAPAPAPANSGNASTTRWTNLYDAPAGNAIGVLAPNTSINIVNRTAAGNWVQVTSAQGNGWIPATAASGGNSGGGGGQASAPTGSGDVRITRWTNVYQSPNGAPLQGVVRLSRALVLIRLDVGHRFVAPLERVGCQQMLSPVRVAIQPPQRPLHLHLRLPKHPHLRLPHLNHRPIVAPSGWVVKHTRLAIQL
ncbi:MAG: hypothetical protein ACPG8W_21690, partial [Candidatus Promineifilaceae bacterium]